MTAVRRARRRSQRPGTGFRRGECADQDPVPSASRRRRLTRFFGPDLDCRQRKHVPTGGCPRPYHRLSGGYRITRRNWKDRTMIGQWVIPSPPHKLVVFPGPRRHRVPDSRCAAVVPSVSTWGITARARPPACTVSTARLKGAIRPSASTRGQAANNEPKRSRVGRWSAAKSAARSTPLSRRRRLPERRTSDRWS